MCDDVEMCVCGIICLWVWGGRWMIFWGCLGWSMIFWWMRCIDWRCGSRRLRWRWAVRRGRFWIICCLRLWVGWCLDMISWWCWDCLGVSGWDRCWRGWWWSWRIVCFRCCARSISVSIVGKFSRARIGCCWLGWSCVDWGWSVEICLRWMGWFLLIKVRCWMRWWSWRVRLSSSGIFVIRTRLSRCRMRLIWICVIFMCWLSLMKIE